MDDLDVAVLVILQILTLSMSCMTYFKKNQVSEGRKGEYTLI